MDQKPIKNVVHLIPYKIKDNNILFYLQKRSKDAPLLPNYFGLFGGSIEIGESPEKAVIRETQEELNYNLINHQYLGLFSFPQCLSHVYYIKVEDDFESKIKIMEGDYGKWFLYNEIISETKMAERIKVELKDLFDKLKTIS